MTEVAICCTTPLSCLTCKLPGIESASTAELHITLKKYYLYIYMKPFVSAEWIFIPQSGPKGRNSISRYFLSQNPKCLFVLQGAETTFHKGTAIFFRPNLSKFINVYRSSQSTDCAAENLKPWVMLRDLPWEPTDEPWWQDIKARRVQ